MQIFKILLIFKNCFTNNLNFDFIDKGNNKIITDEAYERIKNITKIYSELEELNENKLNINNNEKNNIINKKKHIKEKFEDKELENSVEKLFCDSLNNFTEKIKKFFDLSYVINFEDSLIKSLILNVKYGIEDEKIGFLLFLKTTSKNNDIFDLTEKIFNSYRILIAKHTDDKFLKNSGVFIESLKDFIESLQGSYNEKLYDQIIEKLIRIINSYKNNFAYKCAL